MLHLLTGLVDEEEEAEVPSLLVLEVVVLEVPSLLVQVQFCALLPSGLCFCALEGRRVPQACCVLG